MKLRHLAVVALTAILLPAPVQAVHGTTTPVAWFTTAHRGYYHSRYATPRQSIQIGPMPTNEGFPVSWIYNPWNQAAGWNLFTPATTPTGPQQVHFKADLTSTAHRGAWVQPAVLHPNDYLHQCVIHYDPARVGPSGIPTGLDQWGMAHELGHCLGLRDHLNTTITPGAPQCVNPNAANYSAYNGVMEYCDWFSAAYRTNVWFKTGDRCTLEHYRYGIAC